MVRGVAEEPRRIGAVLVGKVQVHSETVIDVLRAVTFRRKPRQDPAPRVRLPRLGGSRREAGVVGGNLDALGAPLMWELL